MRIDDADEGANSPAIVDTRILDRGQTLVFKAATSMWPVADRKTMAEPRLLSLAGTETPIPAPDVFGVYDDRETHPTPFFFMKYVDEVCSSPYQTPTGIEYT